MDFKYKQHIDSLLSLGITLPELVVPNDKHSYRYIFKDIPEKNHIPQYIKKPKRVLTDLDKSTATTSGYALSCFEQEDKAKALLLHWKPTIEISEKLLEIVSPRELYPNLMV